MIEQAVFNNAVLLTVIAIGTAFALLVSVGIIIAIIGRFAGPGLLQVGDDVSVDEVRTDNDRGKAIAAVVAVSALLEKSDKERNIAGDTI